jgi:hypothetical protein
MHRIDRDTLFISLLNLIHCSRLKRRCSGPPILASLETHEGQRKLAELICDRIDNDSTMVIRTEPVGFPHSRPGKWDIDEPAPARVPVPPPPPLSNDRQCDDHKGSA